MSDAVSQMGTPILIIIGAVGMIVALLSDRRRR